jgi:hypothetical protein
LARRASVSRKLRMENVKCGILDQVVPPMVP